MTNEEEDRRALAAVEDIPKALREIARAFAADRKTLDGILAAVVRIADGMPEPKPEGESR